METATNRGRASASPALSGAVSSTDAPARWWAASRSARGVIWIALAIRLTIFPFADNKQADAPMRALIAERVNNDAVAAGDPRSFCQFGPLPIEILRPFLALDPDARRSSRVPSLLAGVAAFLPFFALARRMLAVGAVVDAAGASVGVALGPGVGTAVVSAAPILVAAGLALALSPLHVQVSTTAASEAIYLFLLLAALERLHAAVTHGRRRDYLYAGLWASLAAVTRYDTWLALPVACVAILLFGRRDRRALANVALFAVTSALFPAAYLMWSWRTSGDPFFFARYISQDHAAMAHEVTVRLGGRLARVRQVEIWLISFAAAMTPIAFVAAGMAARYWRRWSAGTRVVLTMALAPPAAYLAKGLLFGDFEPLPRFAIAPGTVLLPMAAWALVAFDRRWRASGRAVAFVAAGAVVLSAVAVTLAFARPGRIWGGAESISPLTRLDGEDRALADYLLSHRLPQEATFVDTFSYVDIGIAHAARVPIHLTATLAHTRTPAPTLAETRALTGATWFAVHDDSWGRTTAPDWPATSQRLGHWRVAHLGPGRVADVH